MKHTTMTALMMSCCALACGEDSATPPPEPAPKPAPPLSQYPVHFSTGSTLLYEGFAFIEEGAGPSIGSLTTSDVLTTTSIPDDVQDGVLRIEMRSVSRYSTDTTLGCESMDRFRVTIDAPAGFPAWARDAVLTAESACAPWRDQPGEVSPLQIRIVPTRDSTTYVSGTITWKGPDDTDLTLHLKRVGS